VPAIYHSITVAYEIAANSRLNIVAHHRRRCAPATGHKLYHFAYFYSATTLLCFIRKSGTMLVEGTSPCPYLQILEPIPVM